MQNISLKGQKVLATSMDDMARMPVGGMSTLILPAKLSKVEEEAVNSIVK